jgi:PST family polysaccharide transporter
MYRFKEIFKTFERKNIKSYLIHYKHLIRNYFSLTLLNALSFIMPLITLPYLVRVIGPEKYGSISFAIVIIQYIILISNYGFSLSATRLISQKRKELEEISEIFTGVIFIRIIIALILTIILISCVFLVPKLYDERFLYFFALGIILGDIFIPTWFFQGLEKMQFITIVNFTSKIVFTILIFFFVNNIDDYPKVMILNSLGYLVAGIVSIFIVIKFFKVKLKFPSKKKIIFLIKDGWYIFLSTININLYRNANIFILGIMTNDTIVGYYSSAEKIVKAVQSIFTPISDTLFPYLSHKFSNQALSESKQNLLKISKYYFIILICLSVFLFVFSRFIVLNYLGINFIESVKDLKILSWIILFGCFNYLLGIIGLINIGEQHKFALFVFIAGIVNIAISIIFIPLLKDLGTSIGMLASEITLFILCVRLLKIKFKKNIQ